MSQFSVIPDLAIVSEFIKEVTGCTSLLDSVWSSWLPGDPNRIAEYLQKIRGWYRPCHLKILNETEDGLQRNPCALIRQLIRPHGLIILYQNKKWKIVRKITSVSVTNAENNITWS